MDHVEMDPPAEMVPAARFVEWAWRNVDENERRHWDHLQDCFSSKDLTVTAGGTEAVLDTDDEWGCRVRRTRAGWQLTGLFHDTNPE
jgi:hypothetical protein